MRRLFFIVTLALLFGLGQQGVALHALTHFAEHQQTQSKGQPQHQVCDKCVVYAGLAAGVTSSGLWIAPVDSSRAFSDHFWIAVPHGPFRHYSARAPPIVL